MARYGIDAEETVQFFPTVGWREEGGWRVRVHGWIYAPVQYSRVRRAAMWLARRALVRRVHKGADDATLRSRLGAFFADSERGERLRILCGGREFVMNRSRPDGHFEGWISLTDRQVDDAASVDGTVKWMDFRACTMDGDPRQFVGRAMLLETSGVSLISDIDDTVKITGVLEPRAVLRSTFCEAFACVPGMAALYSRLRREHDAAFHYVSASPWQLYPFLAEGLTAAGFPLGSFHLRRLRFRGRNLLSAFVTSAHVKRRHLRELLQRFPHRRFILIGDSGEQDGEVYAALARKFPQQVLGIYIRDAGGVNRDWSQVFRDVPNWHLFDDPASLG